MVKLAVCLLLATAALAGCGAGLAERYGTGNRALSSGEGPVYFVVLAPVLHAALNRCIPPGTAGASPTLVVVADVDAAGIAANIEVEPDSPGSDCLRRELHDTRLPKPPLAAGAASFPIGLRIDTR